MQRWAKQGEEYVLRAHNSVSHITKTIQNDTIIPELSVTVNPVFPINCTVFNENPIGLKTG